MHTKTKLKVGDTIVVRSGAHKGKTGKIIALKRKEDAAIVEGINIVKRHTKATSTNATSGVFEKTMPIKLSKLGIKQPSKNAPSRISIQQTAKDKKRIYQKTGKEIK